MGFASRRQQLLLAPATLHQIGIDRQSMPRQQGAHIDQIIERAQFILQTLQRIDIARVPPPLFLGVKENLY